MTEKPATRNNRGLKRVVNAYFHSISGIHSCFKTEEAFRQECFLALLFIPIGLYLGQGFVEKFILCGVVIFILVVELLNTALERAIDRISTKEHSLSKDSKDMGSAAVFLSLFLAGLAWAIIGLPRLYDSIAGLIS